MQQMTETYGAMDEVEAAVRLVSVFHNQKLDWIEEGTRRNRNQWHNLKYYTWVEQQGKTIEELDAQRYQDYWQAQQARVGEIDRKIQQARGD
jgi:cob(I)alamin adenosyltransferase